ncbi:hypothetical protein PMA3_26390 [Pseudomonas silesiensis]|uniref:Uncharacterized protein n=1 Tax=Pseudomonas silesiensis TaxID=1853130 RepID=A0A191Z016_9PSED|nr:hypothetical protein [Pseudomonas silesiensis]ANJ58492.1 hypothetical protein PMA3_26390 [Pseudomonas silesiensis]
MNFDQAKALRLQQWRSTLDDHDFRMENPEAHRQTLREMSATLASEGLIDDLQCFDMNEMANAAYWHAVEELIDAPIRYCGASAYDVVKHGSSELLGVIRRSIFYYVSTLAEANIATYDGKIYRSADGANLVFSPSGMIAEIKGLTLTLPDGQRYELVETGRTIEGIFREPVDDPDSYRGLIDTALVAKESRDLRSFEKLRPLIDLAKFRICPVCLDRFELQEDCTACGGHGFLAKL